MTSDLAHLNRDELTARRAERSCWLIKHSVNGVAYVRKVYDDPDSRQVMMGVEIGRWPLSPHEQTLSLWALERLAESGNIEAQRNA